MTSTEHDGETITMLASRYFADLLQDGRDHSADNLASWLWFTCPADLREPVRAEIELLIDIVEHEDSVWEPLIEGDGVSVRAASPLLEGES
ncbi:MAG: hypothetical protein V2B18_06320 [Pseudomonadota bacterium]